MVITSIPAAFPNHDVKLMMGEANAKQKASTACMRVQMIMASDWSTLSQAGKWRSKVRTSSTNESTFKPGTTQMDKPSTRSITA
jgi:hypothetical protein